MSTLSINNNSGSGSNNPALTKPKRPLSSYNLFYRFKREKIIELGNVKRDDITKIVQASPGQEECYPPAPHDASQEEINELRKRNIRNDMESNLSPRETSTRRHRKNTSAINGGMGFLELGKLMNVTWQNCDDFAKSVFSELADEGRELYKQRLAEYNASCDVSGTSPQKKKKAKGGGVKKVLPSKSNQTAATMALPSHYEPNNYNSMSMFTQMAEMERSLTEGAKRSYLNMCNNMLYASNKNPYHVDNMMERSPRGTPSPNNLGGFYSPSSSPSSYRPQVQINNDLHRRVSYSPTQEGLRLHMNRLEEQLTAAKLRVMELETNLSSPSRLNNSFQDTLRMQKAQDYHRGFSGDSVDAGMPHAMMNNLAMLPTTTRTQDHHHQQQQQEGVDKLAWLASASEASSSLVRSTMEQYAKRRSFDSSSSANDIMDQNSYDGMYSQVNKKQRVA